MTQNDTEQLTHGVLVDVRPSLIKRCRQHFHSFPFGIDMILGCNGYIWLTPTRVAEAAKQLADQLTESDANATTSEESAARIEAEAKGIDVDERENLARVRNAILALDSQFILISPETVQDVYDDSLDMALSVEAMLDPAIFQSLTVRASVRKLES